MRTDDKRKQTSRLNALKSTGPKTPEGKRRSAFNSVTHAAYVQEFILPGEELPQCQLLMDTHLSRQRLVRFVGEYLGETWKPANHIEETFVFEMVTTLWRLRRQAPAESNLINIQMQRMHTALSVEFESIGPNALYALAVVALQANGDALNQIARQGRRLLSQYEKLTQQLLTMRQLFPPVTPEPPNFQPQPDSEPHNEPVETKLTEHPDPLDQSTENETVETQPVETKLTGSVALNLLPCETRVHNPHSILYAALPPSRSLPSLQLHRSKHQQKRTTQWADGQR